MVKWLSAFGMSNNYKR